MGWLADDDGPSPGAGERKERVMASKAGIRSCTGNGAQWNRQNACYKMKSCFGILQAGRMGLSISVIQAILGRWCVSINKMKFNGKTLRSVYFSSTSIVCFRNTLFWHLFLFNHRNVARRNNHTELIVDQGEE